MDQPVGSFLVDPFLDRNPGEAGILTRNDGCENDSVRERVGDVNHSLNEGSGGAEELFLTMQWPQRIVGRRNRYQPRGRMLVGHRYHHRPMLKTNATHDDAAKMSLIGPDRKIAPLLKRP